MIEVDMKNEKFGSAVSIAHLAANGFTDWDAKSRHIYDADEMISREWKWELEKPVEMEYATGVTATFKDGSVLHVAAWGDCCEGQGSGCRHCGQ